MPLKLTGGSLTLSVVVLAAAWTVRSLREQRRRRGSANPPADSSSKFFATLSLEAIALLVRLLCYTSNQGADGISSLQQLLVQRHGCCQSCAVCATPGVCEQCVPAGSNNTLASNPIPPPVFNDC